MAQINKRLWNSGSTRFGFFLLLLIIGTTGLMAQGLQSADLQTFNLERNSLNGKAMTVLGSWAILNMAVNTPLMLREGENSTRYFYQMNAAWNVINVAIAGFGYYGSINPEVGLSLYQSLQEQAAIERILLFNAGLDVGYMATGLWMMEKSKTHEKHAHRLKGYGQSLILQGGFLFVFDLIVYGLQRQNNTLAEQLLSHLSLGPGGPGLVIHF